MPYRVTAFRRPNPTLGLFQFGQAPMDRTAKLYKLYAVLAVVKRGMEQFAALRPDPREWTQEEVAHHDLLIRRRTDIRAEIAELESVHAHRRR